MALRRIDVEVTWGDVSLAFVRASLPVRLDRLLREAGVHLGDKLCADASPRGGLVLRGADGTVRAESEGDSPASCTVHGVTLRAWPAGQDVVLPRRRLDAAWLASVACALSVVAACGLLVRSSGPGRPAAAERRATLSTLARWASRSAPPAMRHKPPDVGAPSPAVAVDPSEDLPDDRAARMDGQLSRGPQRMNPVAQRGILGLDLMSPRTVRTLARVNGAFASMTTAPIREPAPDDDGFHYGTMGVPGAGAGAGCPAGTDCGVVSVRVTMGDGWRPRASAIAHAAMQARAVAPVVIRAAQPEMGELTMGYVQQRVRRDVLADAVRCYADALEQYPDLPSGRVITRFEISTEGRVTAAAIVSSAIARADVESCVLRVLRGASFPPNTTGASVTYPFVFSSLMPDR